MEYNEAVHELFIDLRKVYDSIRKKVLYKLIVEFGIPTKLGKLIKMCLNKASSSI